MPIPSRRSGEAIFARRRMGRQASKMNNKKTSAIMAAFTLIIIITIMSSGCTDTTSSFFNPYSGTEGLSLSFIKNAPSEQIPSETTFTTGVLIENRGAANIPMNEGVVVVSADDFGEYGTILQKEDKKLFALQGKSAMRIFTGERDIMFFYMNAPVVEEKTEQEATITARACYDYNTLAQTSLCLDKSLETYDNTRKACTQQDLIQMQSQGAPVAITRIEVVRLFSSTTKLKFAFKIYVKNMGTGFVIAKNTFNSFCTNSANTALNKNFFGRVNIEAHLANEQLLCTPKAYVDLFQIEEDYILCETKTEYDVSNTAYKSLLTINATYGYVETISQKISVIRLIK
jgi:hypothetical protein